MGENPVNGLGVLKGRNLGLSNVSTDSSVSSILERHADATHGLSHLSRRGDNHRQFSDDSTLIDISEDDAETHAELENRLFRQKYNSLKVQKKKVKIDRDTRNFGKPRDKHFQLPDDLRYALNVACHCDPPTEPKKTVLPKIACEGTILCSPECDDGEITSPVEQTPLPTTGREKVKIVLERMASIDSEPLESPTTKTPKEKDKRKQGKILDTDKSTKRNKVVKSNKRGSGKRNASASKNSSGKSETDQASNIGDRLFSVNKSMPWSQPTSNSTATESSVSLFRKSSSHRKQSRADSVRRQRNREKHADESDDDSDYLESDSDNDNVAVSTPHDASQEVSLYHRACRRYRVVTSRRVEEGLKKGEVDVSFSQLTLKELKVLCVAIVESVNISRIDVSGNDLPQQGLTYLTEVLEENRHIKELNLSECQTDREGVGRLIHCLQHTNTVTWLDLSGISLCLEQVHIIADYIQSSSALQRLYLSYCQIDETGANIIGQALESAINLSFLDLSWNQLRHKGALNFCMALKDNTTLQTLDLSWNGLGKDGCMGLEVALAGNTSLRHLDLACNRICAMGLECLLRGLHNNSTLNSLKIGNNPLPIDSGTAVMNALIACPDSSIQVLDLSHVAVDEDFLAKLAELRKSRVIYVYHGPVMSNPSDVCGSLGNKTLTSFDPLMVLFEYMKLENMRLIELFRSIDVNGDNVISRKELREVFVSLNMNLPTGTFEAMFRKMDLDHNNVIDMDEMKVAHRRVMRQARAMKARASRNDDEGFGDVLHEFQDLVRQAVTGRRSRRASKVDSEIGVPSSHRSPDRSSPRSDKSPQRLGSPRGSIHRSWSISRRSSVVQPQALMEGLSSLLPPSMNGGPGSRRGSFLSVASSSSSRNNGAGSRRGSLLSVTSMDSLDHH